MKNAIFLAAVATCTCSLLAAASDYRPPFDKSDYVGRVGIQANPWFPPNKAPTHTYGGPNVPYAQHPRTKRDAWRQAIETCASYGVDFLVPEVNEPTSYDNDWRLILDAAGTNNPPVKVGMFFGLYSNGTNGVVASMKTVLGRMRKQLNSHPAVLRADGHPVMVIYYPTKFKPEEWKTVFDALDAEFGRMVYLMNMNDFVVWSQQKGGSREEQDRRFEKRLREYLPYFDGISSYGTGFRVPFDVIKKVMADYPQKINEGEALFTYLCHFQMGGSQVDLSKTWRDHLAGCYSSNPDTILLTNLLDQYENSAVYPCYEREDLVLRHLEWTLGRWKKRKGGHKFKRMKSPELVVCNWTSVLLGWQNLDFEVLGFPMDALETRVKVELDICDASGKVLYTFPARDMDLNTFRAERFSVPSTQFAGERGVVPRLRYEWIGRKTTMNYGPMTLIDPSLRPFRLFWARSTKNTLAVDGKNEWTLDDVGVGGTHHPVRTGVSQFSSRIKPNWVVGNAGGKSRSGIRRDGLEFNYGYDLNCSFAIPVPNPGGALHWYHLEMENAKGRKYQTLPIWDTDGSREKMVKIPVWKEDGDIADFEIEDTRVPCWYYPVERDCGDLLLDESGWQHNGRLLHTKAGLFNNHLGFTGYNHYHNGCTTPRGGKRCFRRDPDGRGYLSFDGTNDYATVAGCTAFPGACTYELSVRPAEIGREMGLVGSANGQIEIAIMPDGAVRASRSGAVEGMGGSAPTRKFKQSVKSKTRLPVGKWAKIAVTYDLRTIRLYVNGTLEGEADIGPTRDHEWINHVTIGAKCGFVHETHSYFHGDIRNIRMYGRNLSAEEFL